MIKLKLIFYTILACIWLNSSLFAQRNFGNKVFYAQLGGNAYGAVATINFDFRANMKKNNGLGFAIGIGGWTGDNGTLAIPLTLNYLLGNPERGSFLELGIGATLQNGYYLDPSSDPFFFGGWDHETKYNSILGHMIIGFRKQKPDQRFNFRVGLNPFFGTQHTRDYFSNDDNEVESKFIFWPIWPYISWGVAL